MRKVSKIVASAFINGNRKTSGNTSTDGKVLELHGNTIAERIDASTIRLTLAGWGTPTTRERLNAICELAANVRPFHQLRGTQCVNGSPIDPDSSVFLCTDSQGSMVLYTECRANAPNRQK